MFLNLEEVLFVRLLQLSIAIVRLCLAEDEDLEAEVDEMGRFVQSK